MRTPLAITVGIAAITMISATSIAQESHHGTVVQVEEAKGTITVSEAVTTGSTSQANTAQEYKVQDGLLFNALNVGDVVTFTAEEKGGVKTITNLQAK
jgi:Cu/Ag efflux protein CusF